MEIAQLIPAYNEAVFYPDRSRALQPICDVMNSDNSPEEVIFEVAVPALEQMVIYSSENVQPNLVQYFMITPIVAEVTAKITPVLKNAGSHRIYS